MPRPPRIDPAMVQAWADAAARLRAADHGARTAMVRELAEAHGLGSADAVYRRLRDYGGWESGRARRADAGRMAVDAQTVERIAAVYREAARADGRRIMSLDTAVSLVEASGTPVPVSTSQVGRYLRAGRLDARSQGQAEVFGELRSLHPNHVHQIDPSLCVVYYMKGQQHVLRAEDYYKNKLDRIAKIDTKVWRYVRTDHASGCIDLRYYVAAGESQALLFDFLMWTWGRQPGRLTHGVPRILMWDAGSANIAHGVCQLLDALEVRHDPHMPGCPNVKGQVENANLLVERSFESRLKFEPQHTIEALNAAAAQWREAFNANRLPRVDARIHRPGADPLVRSDLWMLIRPEQIRELPPREVCARLLAGRPETRTVTRQAFITFPHPALGRSVRYNLRSLPEIHRGDVVTVSPLLLGADGESGLVRLTHTDPRGETRTWRVAPELALDDYGRPLSAAIIGEQFRAPATREAEQAAARLDALAFPAAAAAAAADAPAERAGERARKARRDNVTPFQGQINAISHLAEIETPTYLPRRGEAIALTTPEDHSPPVPLVRALSRLRAAWGRAITPAEAGWLRARYGEQIPEAELARLLADAPDCSGAGAPAEAAADGPRQPLRAVRT